MTSENLEIFETHAHLDMKPFDKDRAETLQRARDAGVIRIINIGIDIPSSRKSIQLAEKHDDIFATVGIHPHDASGMKKGDIDVMAEMARHPKVVAIGELGLDFFRDRSPRVLQYQALEAQLELASKLSLPVVVHSRSADKEMIDTLKQWTEKKKPLAPNPPGVIHCFNSDPKTVLSYLEMGFCIAIGAYISYPKSTEIYDAVRTIPAERLLVETDCPFLPPQEFRGKRNEPSYLPITIEKIAEIRRKTPSEIARITTENAFRLFNLPTD